ncbi:MAG: polyphosphate kinase 2 [Flavobacteriaceae bacterium]|jgi:polyphosphate kinase|nr:polyphosphate kinase 2 [Flavobacteriaceae bacterium]
MEKLTPHELDLINSKLGLKILLNRSKTELKKVLERIAYENKLIGLQKDMIKLQQWVIEKDKKVVVLFEGRDAAGKGGAIRRAIQHLNPRHLQVVALDVPSADEKKQWFFQRYINHLPKPGEIVFFDRSWYNRAVVEPVNGFCTQKQYETFMGQVNEFEKMLIESDTYLIKIYFSISKEEQAKRFEEIKTNPLKQWKITPVDLRAQELWDTYTHYKKMMFAKTHSAHAPWHIIEANPKMNARLEALELILNTIPYESKN